MQRYMNKLPLSEKIKPEHTALLVIDIQNDFCAPDGLLGKRSRDLSLMDPMIDKLIRLITTADNKNVLTIYSQQIYDPQKLNPLQKEQYDLDGKLITCDISTSGYKFYRINPPLEKVYIKHNYNIFSNPKIIEILERHRIKTLIITGVDSQYCIETAIRNGFDLGYKIVVPEDLIATSAKHIDMQNRTLELVRKTYGVVVKCDDLVNLWENSL